MAGSNDDMMGGDAERGARRPDRAAVENLRVLESIEVELTVETSDRSHAIALVSGLVDRGYRVRHSS